MEMTGSCVALAMCWGFAEGAYYMVYYSIWLIILYAFIKETAGMLLRDGVQDKG